jgi:hypothetical protein
MVEYRLIRRMLLLSLSLSTASSSLARALPWGLKGESGDLECEDGHWI